MILKAACVRLFAEDIRAVKAEARKLGLSWTTHLRCRLHVVLAGPKLRAWKFLLPPGKHHVLPDGWIEAGCGAAAVAVATTVDEARALLVRLAAEDSLSASWLQVADVVEIPLDSPTRLIWVQTREVP